MSYGLQPASGYRRYDIHFAAAEATAQRFEGLKRGASPSQALAAFKRAAPHLGVSARLVHLVDLLFAWTKPQDWEGSAEPIVWPKNETLAELMGLEVRQLQNLLKRAVALRLISHKDSPNGHRGGARGRDGAILWSYGIDLRPIGTRMGEFVHIAEEAALERKQRDDLRRRLTIARKSIAQIAQTAMDSGYSGYDWLEAVELARMAADHVRGSRSIEALATVVAQLEQRKRTIHAAFAAAIACMTDDRAVPEEANLSVDITPADEENCMDYTTTTHLQPAKAGIRNDFPKKGSDGGDASPGLKPATPVESDLDKHGITVEFIRSVCKTTCWELDYGSRTWRDVIGIAETMAGDYFVSARTWAEACRLMGSRGAAAAMIAIAEKADTIKNPPAYLHGMIKRALIGELHLGRTFHGLKDGGTLQ